MPRVNFNDLEKDTEPTFIGHRKSVQLNTETSRRTQKRLKGRESLSERSGRKRTTSQRRHQIFKTRKSNLQKLMNEDTQIQTEALLEDFKLSTEVQETGVLPTPHTKETAEKDPTLREELEKVFLKKERVL